MGQGGPCLSELLPASQGTVKEEGAPGSPPQGTVATKLPHLKSSFVVTEQAVLLWTNTRMETPEQEPLGAGLRLFRHLARQRRSPRPLAAQQESNGVGPGEAPEGARSRRAPGPGSTSEDPPHLSAPLPGRDGWPRGPRPRPFVMHMRAPRLRKGPLQTLSHRRRALFFPSLRAWHMPCCFQVASHSLSP